MNLKNNNIIKKDNKPSLSICERQAEKERGAIDKSIKKHLNKLIFLSGLPEKKVYDDVFGAAIVSIGGSAFDLMKSLEYISHWEILNSEIMICLEKIVKETNYEHKIHS